MSLFLLFSVGKSDAQCPGCNIDTTLTQRGIYPHNLPNGTQGQPYSTDVTFVMFLDTSGYTVNYFKILSVSNVPFGLQWECNSSGNGCQYNPAQNIRGCVRICGTPLQSGTFTITCYIVTNLQGVGNFNSTQILTVYIAPGTGGNSGFAFSPAQSCDSAAVSFNGLISGAPSPTTYNWHFGNGDSSNVKTPPVQHYNTPGDYYVSLKTQILGFKITQVRLATIQPGWDGDVEEPTHYFYNPDPFFTLYNSQGALMFTSPVVSDSLSATWSNLNLNLTAPPYTLVFTDYDVTSVNDPLGTFPFDVTSAPGTIPFADTAGSSGSITVDTIVIQSFTHYDTIHVYASPTPVTVTTVGNDSVCLGDSVQLSINGAGANTIEWFNDTALLNGVTVPNYTTHVSGSFWVRLTNANGCTFSSAHQNVVIVPPPPLPTFIPNVNMLTCILPGYDLQWNMNGTPIPGATSQTYEITQDGTYSVTATNAFGCKKTSYGNTIVWTDPVAGVNELALLNSTSVFPNPADDELNFIVNEKIIGYHYTLTDFVGRAMLTGLVDKATMKLSLNALSQGMYFLTIEGKTKKTFKVLKN